MSSPSAVLLLDQYATLGGGQRILCGTVRRCIERGSRVAVAIPEGPLRAVIAEMGAELYPLDVPAIADERKGAFDAIGLVACSGRLRTQLRQAVADFSPDLIHVNGARALVATTGSGPTPVTFHAHTVQSRGSAAVTRMLLQLSRTSRVITPSDFMAAWVERSYGIDSSVVSVVSNWVDSEFVEDSPYVVRAISGGRGNVRVGVVGRITPIKGQLDALKAVLIARERGLDVRLVVAGAPDQSYLDQLFGLTAGTPGALEVLGMVDNVPALLRTLDIALVPSLRAAAFEESFGLAAVEAMAVGVPVVAYASGALPEVIGEAGVLVPVGDVDQLALAMARLAVDQAERARLADAGRARVSEQFDYETQADALCTLFDAVATKEKA